MSNEERKCWICGSPADSGEHKFKKSEVRSLIGKWFGGHKEKSLLLNDTGFHQVHGPNSNVLKYKKSICKKCNDSLSQPFDNAYDIFVKWIIQNDKKVIKKR
jgi:hypothetical protein